MADATTLETQLQIEQLQARIRGLQQQLAEAKNAGLPGKTEAKPGPCEPPLSPRFRPSHQQLRRIADSDILGMLSWDENCNVLDANDHFLKMIGATIENVRAGELNVAKMTPEKDRERDQQALREVAESGVCRPFEKEFIGFDGRHVPAIVWAASQEGAPGAMGVCFVLDISQQKKTEAKLLAATEQLSLILASLPLVSYTCRPDPEFTSTFLSDNVVDLTGFSPHDFLGKPEFWRSRIHPDDAPRVLENLDRLLESGQSECEYRWKVRDGSYRQFWDCVHLRRRPDGEPSHLVGAWKDITLRTRAIEKARELREQLAYMGRVSTMGEMASELAHELNQPLSAAANYCYVGQQMLSKTLTPNNADLSELLRKIENQTIRAGEIVRRIRNHVHNELSARTLCNLNDIVIEVVELLEAETQKKQVRLHVELASSRPRVLVNSIEIQQVLVNLYRNALEAVAELPADRRSLTIVSSQTAANAATVSVCDAGVGIPPDSTAQVFDAFFTTKANGMGMGLAISHSIIESHQGELSVKPNAGHGVTFSFTLPTA